MFYKICELCKDTSSSLMVLYVWMVGPGAVVSFFVLCIETKWLHGSQSVDPEIFSGMSEVLCGLLLWVEGDEFQYFYFQIFQTVVSGAEVFGNRRGTFFPI